MKSKLQTSTAIFLLFISLGAVLAQDRQAPPRPASPVAPAMAPPQPTYAYPAGPMIDPTTGLPIPQPVPEWKDPEWKDPDKTLPEVFYDGLPVSEIARNLGEEFKGEFDMLLPHDYAAGRQGSEGVDWINTPVHLRLKNVKASEVFNAMNLLFENNRTPLRWELKINGSRRIALLRVLEDPRPAENPGSQMPFRKVYFIGHLIGDEKSGFMSMQQIVKTITDLWKMTGSQGTIQFHDEAQLVVVTGTAVQIDFVDQTLTALNQKVRLELDRNRQNAAASKPNTDEPKPNTVPRPN